MKFIQVDTEDHAAIVESLAGEIWTEHYIPIIGAEQVAYMLGRFQSRPAIAAQIRSGVLYYLMQRDREYIGYIAVHPRNDEMFLSKIYVKKSMRARGYGRKAVQFTEALARERRLPKIALTVNKNNLVAIRAYEKIGFRNVKSLVQDIGDGFVMDDYRMEKRVDTASAGPAED